MNSAQTSSVQLSSPSPNSDKRKMSESTKTAGVHTRSPRSRYSLTYADWITRALMAAKDKCSCLSDIYEWMSFNVPGLQEQRFLHSSKGWKNAVRHTLSINPRFQKLKRLGKPALWTLSEDYLRQAQALTKISMSIAPRRDSGDGVQMEITDVPSSAASPPQSKICYIGKSTSSPITVNHHQSAAAEFESKMATLTQETLRNSALLHDQFRNANLFTGASSGGTASLPTASLMQAADAAAAAGRAQFLSDLSALASLNALISANHEQTVQDGLDPLRQRLSAETAALAAAAAHIGTNGAASNVSATPPLMNFFAPSTNCPYSSRRGSGDSGISSISTASGTSTNGSNGGASNVMESLRPFHQSLDVTTLNGLDATLVLPRPLPIQCLTDHKLLLASLIWPNPAANFLQ